MTTYFDPGSYKQEVQQKGTDELLGDLRGGLLTYPAATIVKQVLLTRELPKEVVEELTALDATLYQEAAARKAPLRSLDANATPMGATSSAAAVDALPRWKVLFLGMLKPDTYMRLHESSLSGISHFYRTFSIYCLLPVVLLNLVAIITHAHSPEIWHFQDINPWTVLIAVPAQLIVGPLNIWVMAWCMYGSMRVLYLNPARVKERALTTGWYVGTTLWCLGYWLFGFGVFFGSIQAIGDSVVPVLIIGLIAGIAVWIWVAWSAYKANLSEPNPGKGAKVFFGLVLGALFFFLALLSISSILHHILVTILQGP